MREETLQVITKMQRREVAEHAVYTHLAKCVKGPNAKVLARIADAEANHARIWGQYTGVMPKCPKWQVLYHRLLAVVFGLMFVINMMETSEEKAQEIYESIADEVPEALSIYREEQEHEQALIALIDEERLKYISSMVLGLNDALVELTGALAGFTFALGDSRVIAMAGFITGSAATLSMAASEYLAKKNDPGETHPLKAAVYTGIAYMIAVTALLIPFFFIPVPVIALLFCLVNVAIVILLFTFFVSVVRKVPFKPAFFEMICISFGVAAISFVISWLVRTALGIDL